MKPFITTLLFLFVANFAVAQCAPSITTQPVDDTLCSGGNASFSLSATGTSLTYQWFSNSIALTNGTVYSGVTSPTLSISSATSAMSGNTYYCVVSGQCSPAATSNIAILTVNATPTISITSNPTVCAGTTTVSLSYTATNSPSNYNIAWGTLAISAGFANVPSTVLSSSPITISVPGSASAGTYTGTLTASLSTTGCASAAASFSVTISSTSTPAISIAVSPTAAACSTIPDTFTATITNGGSSPSYQWKKNGVNVASGIASTYIDNNPVSGNAITCVLASSASCAAPISVISNTIYESVTAGPSIIAQPLNASLCAGSNASFSLTATGAGLTYQWFSNSIPLTNGSVFTGVTTPTLSISGVTTSMTGNTYYCVVNGQCSPAVTSNVVMLVVDTPFSITYQPTNASACACGVPAQFTIGATGAGLSFQWYHNNSPLVNGNGYSGVDSGVLTVTVNNPSQVSLFSGSYYCAVTSICSSTPTISDSASLVFQNIPSSSISGNDTICAGANASFTVAGGCQICSYGYSWLVDSGNGWQYLNVVGSNTLNLIGVTSSMNGFKYRCQINNCCYVMSDSAVLIIDSPTSITTQPHNDTICNGSNSGFRVHVTGSGPTYQWQADTSGAGFYNLSNAGVYSGVTTDSLTITSAGNIDSFRYRCIITGTCGSTTSDTAVLRVLQTPAISTIGNSLCGGTYPFGSFQWYANNTVISGAVNQCFTPSASLCYSYIITASANATCQSTPLCYADCNADSLTYTSSVSGFTASFSSTATPPATWQTLSYHWYFGDNNWDTVANPVHTYTSPGVYYTSLLVWRFDTATNYVQCIDSFFQVLNVGNVISGSVYIDTVSTNPYYPSFKIWLITYDTISNTLTAVDSTVDTGANFMANYQFINEPAGDYLVKAMITNGPTSGIGPVPTYGLDSLHWSGAVHISSNGTDPTPGNDIYMLQDSVTSGPGFIAGNVTSGANKGTKGTGAPVDSMLILLENVNSHFIKHTYTDASGNYSFSNLGYGTYIVYPEEMNYATAPWTGITVSNGNTNITATDFEEHTISKTITPANTGVKILAAENEVHIYPNPAKGSVNILLKQMPSKNTQTIITDLVGHKLLETPTTSLHSVLDLSGLAPGVYFISIKGDNINHIQKIILQQ